LEVISNTASVFGPKLYASGTLRCGISFFSDQYMAEYNTPERGELLLYMIKNLVEYLNNEHQGLFISQTIEYIKRYAQNKTFIPLVLLALKVLTQYFEYNVAGSNDYLSILLENITPLIGDDTENAQLIFQGVGDFFKVSSL
jgi:hypothetical protein